MLKLRSLLLTSLCIAGSVNAEIRQTNSLATIVDYCKKSQNEGKNVLVLTDIDDTIALRVVEISPKAWLSNIIAPFFSFSFYRNIIVNFFDNLHYIQRLEPMEPETVPLFQELQQAHIPVVALTARPGKVADRTMEQFQSIGLDLTHNNLNLENQEIDLQAIYKQGIIYCGTQEKGPIAAEFLKKNAIKPDLLVFIDDLKKHAESVNTAMEKEGIPCMAFHYTHKLPITTVPA